LPRVIITSDPIKEQDDQTLALKMTTELEDEDDWAVSDEINDEDSGENNVIAESALDRLTCGLGGKAILPHINSNGIKYPQEVEAIFFFVI
jgi:hypothetical protein